MNACCRKECFLKINETFQKDFHDNFWNCDDYQAQNMLLRGLMKKKLQSKKNMKPAD